MKQERLTGQVWEGPLTRETLYSDFEGDFTRAYVSAEDGDVPALTVFTRRDGMIRHFWSAEMSMEMADPDQDPRGAPDLDPLWTIFDCTPDGRGPDWYPKLEYSQGAGKGPKLR